MGPGDYGWCGWVGEETCRTREQLEAYYLRNGILLCVSYLLGSEDLHYENLIACGEYPVVVDLEMGIGSRGTERAREELTETERVYKESVLQTGLLPLHAWNSEGEGVNVGAINGGGGQLVPMRLPVVREAGSVRMHVEYGQPEMEEGKNLATWNGRFIEPYEFLEPIEEGFERAYRFLMGCQEEAGRRLTLFRNTPLRYLIRDTQQYAMLLVTSYAPKYKRSEAAREEVLTCIGYRREEEPCEEQEWLLAQEVAALREGDIPYFSYDPWSRELRGGDGQVREAFFSKPVIEGVEKRWRQMSAGDLRLQKKLIGSVLRMGTKTGGPGPDPGKKKETRRQDEAGGRTAKQKGLAVAVRIGEILREEAIWSEDRREVGWISMMMAGYRERSYLIRPMNRYLYDGLAGVAVFMAALAERTKEARFGEMAEALTG